MTSSSSSTAVVRFTRSIFPARSRGESRQGITRVRAKAIGIAMSISTSSTISPRSSKRRSLPAVGNAMLG